MKIKKTGLPFDQGILPLDTIETPSRRYLGTIMFIAALFTVAKIWKQPKCPSTDEQRKEM